MSPISPDVLVRLSGAGSEDAVSQNTPEIPTVESASQNRPEHSIGGILTLAGGILAKCRASDTRKILMNSEKEFVVNAQMVFQIN